MILRALIIAAGAASLAACAVAPDPDADRRYEAKMGGKTLDNKLDQDEIVCKKDDVPGSMIPKRVCKTRGEWAEQRQRGRDAADGVQRRGLMTPDPMGG